MLLLQVKTFSLYFNVVQSFKMFDYILAQRFFNLVVFIGDAFGYKIVHFSSYLYNLKKEQNCTSWLYFNPFNITSSLLSKISILCQSTM